MLRFCLSPWGKDLLTYASSVEATASFPNLRFSFTKSSLTVRDLTGSGVFYSVLRVHIDWICAPANSIEVVALHVGLILILAIGAV